MDLTKLSDADLFALQSGDLTKLSDDGLMMLAGKDLAKPAVKKAKEYGLTDYVRPVLSGLTFNLSDEIGAGMAAIPAAIATGTNPIAAYKDMVGNIRAQQNEFAVDNPKTEFAGNVAGALLSGGLGGVKLAGMIPKTFGPASRLASIGAIEGAVGGYGGSESDTLGGDLMGASQGAAVGGLLGGAVAPVGYAASKGYGLLQDAAANLRGPSSVATRRLANVMAQDGITPRMLETQMRKLGPGALPADVIASRSQGFNLLDEIANRPGGGGAAIYNALAKRSDKYLDRLEGSILKNVHPDAGKVSRTIDNMKDEVSEITGPLYREAGGKYPKMTKSLNSILENREIENRVSGAAEKLLSDPRQTIEVKRQALRYLKAKEAGKPAKPNLAMLDQVKKELDEVSTNFASKMSGNQSLSESSRFANISKLIRDELDDQGFLQYKKARGVHAAGKKLEEAIDTGSRGFKDAPEDVVQAYKELGSEAEKDAFRLGISDKMYGTVRGAKPTAQGNAPSIHSKFGSRSQKEVLKEALPRKQFIQLQRDLKAEEAFNKLKGIFGNSRTFAREQNALQNLDPLGAAGDIAAIGHGNVGAGSLGLLRRAFNATKGAGDKKSYDAEMVRMLLKPDNLKATLKALEENGSLLPKWAENLIGPKAVKANKFLANTENRKMITNYLAGAAAASGQ